MDHVGFLCTIQELSWAFTGSGNIEQLLRKVVTMVARHISARVCSIYLYDHSRRELSLCANIGLNTDAAGPITLKPGEGLTGIALETMQPVCVNGGSSHPGYKFFIGSNEELFDAFCAVPILRGIHKIGVLVVQREKTEPFSAEEITAMRAVSNQLATTIENAQMLLDIETRTDTPAPDSALVKHRFLRGKVASRGFAYAEAVVAGREQTLDDAAPADTAAPTTHDDFIAALDATRRELEELQRRVEERLADGASLIFGAHLLLLKDPQFTGEMAQKIDEGYDAIVAVQHVARKYIDLFSRQESEYLREKRDDVKDLARRLLSHLTRRPTDITEAASRIVVARELLPSDILKLAFENVAGIILVSGGVTSHLSILARSLALPLMICDEPGLTNLPGGVRILMDGDQGTIYLNPDNTIVATFLAREKANTLSRATDTVVHPTTSTVDNIPVGLFANINLLSDLDAALAMQAEGVGLYRTEFPFMIRATFPSEEEQFVIYRKLNERMSGREVTFRTLDIGGDKVLSHYHDYKENNPFLGMRSLRFTLSKQEIFIDQIRAILRAGFDARLRIMFPMVSSLDEFRQARAIVTEAIADLKRDGIAHNSAPAIGMMVELPSVLSIIDVLAAESDFFSIGSNDFIQYMLAVDRTNEKVASFYLPHHPAVLRGINTVVAAARAKNRVVSICGDMAHEVRYIPLLLGIGIRSFSVDPGYIPAIQRTIESVNMRDAQTLAHNVLSTASILQIEGLLGMN
jgi:phosphotransferase system enzyme I (PtsP)